MLLRPAVLASSCALVLCVLAAGCDSSSTGGGDGGSASAGSEDSAITVPDVTDDDGADAISEVEDASLTATPDSADGSSDPGDGAGCTVTDQDPTGGSDAGEGDEVTLTMDCRQRDWENQEGDVWDEFSSGFSTGFSDGCDQVFDIAQDGTLHGDTEYDEYTVSDCQGLEPDPSDSDELPGDVPDDPESEGEAEGFDAGCQALFDDAGTDTFYWGTDSVTAEDCQAQGPNAAPATSTKQPRAPSSSAPATSHAKTSGETCPTATTADGDTVRISVDRGKVNCPGALALWNAYIKRAPSEGKGSGGALDVDGWQCIASPAARTNVALGSCTNDDATFIVRPG